MPSCPDLASSKKPDYFDGILICPLSPNRLRFGIVGFRYMRHIVHNVSQPTNLFLDQGHVWKYEYRLPVPVLDNFLQHQNICNKGLAAASRGTVYEILLSRE